MASNTDKFLMIEKDQSYFKHRFLKHYAPQFAFKLAKSNHPVTIIDGFAGIPLDINGSKGSAPTLIDIATKDSLINIYLVDNNQKYTKAISNYISELNLPNEIKHNIFVENADSESILPDIISTNSNRSILMYLDPCGYGIAYHLIKQFITRNNRWPRTELILNIGSQFIIRPGAGTVAGTYDGTKINKALGGDWWLEIVEDLKSSGKSWGEIYQTIITAYCEKLKQDTGSYVFPFPFRARPDENPIFYLICASQSNHGVFAYSDSFAKAWIDWLDHLNRKVNQGTLFATDETSSDEATRAYDPSYDRGVPEALELLKISIIQQLRSTTIAPIHVGKQLRIPEQAIGRLTNAEIGKLLKEMESQNLLILNKGKRVTDYQIYPVNR